MSERIALLLTFARRGEDGEVERALNHLRGPAAGGPGAHVAALGTPVSEPVLRQLGVEDLILYGGGKGARAAVREARALRPGTAAILYCGPGFAAHLKLEAFALLSGAGKLHLLSPGLPVKTIGRLRLAWSVSVKALATGVHLLVGALICGVAFACLRLSQMLAGGRRVSGA